jgi:hypothetical protein
MMAFSLAVALLLSSTQGINIYSHSNIHSRVMNNIRSNHKQSNRRLEAWNEVYKNVNDNEYMQSEENALNE